MGNSRALWWGVHFYADLGLNPGLESSAPLLDLYPFARARGGVVWSVGLVGCISTGHWTVVSKLSV